MGLLNWMGYSKKSVDQTTLATQVLLGRDPSGALTGFGKTTDGKFLASPKINAIVYACVTTIARAFQEAPMQVEKKNAEGQWEIDPNSDILDPWTRNKWLSVSEIQQYQAMHVELTGKSYVWLWRDKSGTVREVWPLPPTWVVPEFDDAGLDDEDGDDEDRVVSYWKVTPTDTGTGNGKSFNVSVKDMVYTRFVDPANLYDGMSPLDSAYKYVEIDEKTDEYANNSVTGLNLPSVVVTSETVMSESQKEDLGATLRQKLGAKAQKGSIVLEGTGIKIEAFNPLADFDFSGLNDAVETRICMVFHVPPIVVGASFGIENSPWSNIGDAQRWFYRFTISGLWKMFGTKLTRAIIPESDWGNTRISYNLDDIKEMQEDTIKTQDSAIKLFNAAIINHNEARTKVGYEAIVGGDVFKMKINEVFSETLAIPIDSLTNTEEEHLTGNEDL